MATLYPVVEKVGLQLLLEPQMSGIIFKAACSSVGAVYPIYQSFKTIEDRRPTRRDQQWLTYWAIYGMISLAEGAGGDWLPRLPYYWHAKFALLVWLQLPGTQGAWLLYQRYLRPPLVRYEPKIDVCVDHMTRGLSTLYALYKVPIDAAVACVGYGAAQFMAFLRWLATDDGSSSGPPRVVTPPPGSQFLIR